MFWPMVDYCEHPPAVVRQQSDNGGISTVGTILSPNRNSGARRKRGDSAPDVALTVMRFYSVRNNMRWCEKLKALEYVCSQTWHLGLVSQYAMAICLGNPL